MDTGEIALTLEPTGPIPARTPVRLLSETHMSAIIQTCTTGLIVDCDRAAIATGTQLLSLNGPAPF